MALKTWVALAAVAGLATMMMNKRQGAGRSAGLDSETLGSDVDENMSDATGDYSRSDADPSSGVAGASPDNMASTGRSPLSGSY